MKDTEAFVLLGPSTATPALLVKLHQGTVHIQVGDSPHRITKEQARELGRFLLAAGDEGEDR